MATGSSAVPRYMAAALFGPKTCSALSELSQFGRSALSIEMPLVRRHHDAWNRSPIGWTIFSLQPAYLDPAFFNFVGFVDRKQ